jgi:hypothetical protein
MIATAIAKSGRPIVLSLSPGPTHLDHASEISRYAQMWRISNDIWDSWHFPYNPKTDGYPSGVDTAFDNLAKWNPFVRPGAWPDADMLPFGALMPFPGMGEPRMTRLSPEEERTQFTLWSIARSPLILGANLTKLNAFTRRLITNGDVIAINQAAWESHPVANLPPGFEHLRIWEASAGARARPTHYVAFFNLDEAPAHISATWKQLGIAGEHSALELWSGAKISRSTSVTADLPAHGTTIYRLGN